jgi:hypothetical protein
MQQNAMRWARAKARSDLLSSAAHHADVVTDAALLYGFMSLERLLTIAVAFD